MNEMEKIEHRRSCTCQCQEHESHRQKRPWRNWLLPILTHSAVFLLTVLSLFLYQRLTLSDAPLIYSPSSTTDREERVYSKPGAAHDKDVLTNSLPQLHCAPTSTTQSTRPLKTHGPMKYSAASHRGLRNARGMSCSTVSVPRPFASIQVHLMFIHSRPNPSRRAPQTR